MGHLPSRYKAMSSNSTLACFNYLVFSLGWLTPMDTCLSGGDFFYSYNRLLFWTYMLHITSLCSIWETLWGEHVVTGNAATMMEPPCVQRHLATPLGWVTPSCHPLKNYSPWLKFFKLMSFLYTLFLLHFLLRIGWRVEYLCWRSVVNHLGI
jgi:hypothetical protein